MDSRRMDRKGMKVYLELRGVNTKHTGQTEEERSKHDRWMKRHVGETHRGQDYEAGKQERRKMRSLPPYPEGPAAGEEIKKEGRK